MKFIVYITFTVWQQQKKSVLLLTTVSSFHTFDTWSIKRNDIMFCTHPLVSETRTISTTTISDPGSTLFVVVAMIGRGLITLKKRKKKWNNKKKKPHLIPRLSIVHAYKRNQELGRDSTCGGRKTYLFRGVTSSMDTPFKNMRLSEFCLSYNRPRVIPREAPLSSILLKRIQQQQAALNQNNLRTRLFGNSSFLKFLQWYLPKTYFLKMSSRFLLPTFLSLFSQMFSSYSRCHWAFELL